MRDRKLTGIPILLSIGSILMASLSIALSGEYKIALTVSLGILLSGMSSVFFLLMVRWGLPKANDVFMTAVFGPLLCRLILGSVTLGIFIFKVPGLVPVFLWAFLGSYLVFLVVEIWVLATRMEPAVWTNDPGR